MKVIYWALACLILVSCGSSKTPFCIGDQNKNLTVRWGIMTHESGFISGYALMPDGELESFRIGQHGKAVVYDKIKKLNDTAYCSAVAMVRDEFLKTQALNQPGDTLNMIEYSNPDLKVELFAIWNPKFNNKGNEGFRKVLAGLEKLLPAEK